LSDLLHEVTLSGALVDLIVNLIERWMSRVD